MSAYRLKRIQEEIQHVVSALILFDMTDPEIKGVTVTRVLVTKDLGLARIYYETIATKKEEKSSIHKALNRARGFVRKQLASKLSIKMMPEIEFFYDETKEEVSRVEELFSKI